MPKNDLNLKLGVASMLKAFLFTSAKSA